MNVTILTVQRKGTQTFSTPRAFLANINRLQQPSRLEEQLTQVLFQLDARYQNPPEGWQVLGNYQTIQNSLAGELSPDSNINIVPDKINGVANSTPVQIKMKDILYAYADANTPADAVLHVINPINLFTSFKYTFTNTDLQTLMFTLNNPTLNMVMSVTFGACTDTTQAITYDVSEACTLQLQKREGVAWVPLHQNDVAAGTGSTSFTFHSGDLVSGNGMRVVALVDSQVIVINEGVFACTGGTASGSGPVGDCTQYAYFDGSVYDPEEKTINVGATCSVGYNIQISTSADFADTDKYVADFTTPDTITQVPDLAAGTYYTRVRNASGETRWSNTETFTVS